MMTEIAPSDVQAAEMGFLQRVHAVTLRDKVHSCEIRRISASQTFCSATSF